MKKQACHKRVTSVSQRVTVEKQEIWIAADPSPLPRTRQGSVWDSQGTPGGRRAEKPPPQEWQQRPEPARPGGRPPSSRSPLRRCGCRSCWRRARRLPGKEFCTRRACRGRPYLHAQHVSVVGPWWWRGRQGAPRMCFARNAHVTPSPLAAFRTAGQRGVGVTEEGEFSPQSILHVTPTLRPRYAARYACTLRHKFTTSLVKEKDIFGFPFLKKNFFT